MSGVQVEGRSVACLVAADVLARAGVPVRLAVEGGLGKGFAPYVTPNGWRVELGPRLLELSYDEGAGVGLRPDVLEYTGGDHRAWMGHIRDYILGLVDPRPVPLQIHRNDTVATDFLLTGDLRSLRCQLDDKERHQVEADALQAMRNFPNGIDHGDLRNWSYRVASRALHGVAFDRIFIRPLLDAMLGPEGDLPASLHRKVWLPLFKPIEVLQGVWGESQRPRRTMWLGMTDAVSALINRVEPLRETDLPSGERTFLFDTPPTSDPKRFPLHFVWTPTGEEMESVTWLYHGRDLPFRRTVANGTACLEFGPDRQPWSGFAGESFVLSTHVPIGSAQVDVRAGVIGAGSFNSQIIQGLSASAWRLR